MKRARHQQGSVVLNKRSKTWHYLWCEDNHRRSKLIGTLRDYPTKAAAWHVAGKASRCNTKACWQCSHRVGIGEAIRNRKNATRCNTARVYRAWLHNHVLPQWGDKPITDVKPRDAELWLRQLDLSPKSRSHVRHILYALMDFAMFSGVIEVGRNPIDLFA